MKKKIFATNITVALHLLSNYLGNNGLKFNQFGTMMVIDSTNTTTIKTIKNAIKRIICEVFNCNKASRYCKINILENKIYVRFKTA
jgi:hypothetical protein